MFLYKLIILSFSLMPMHQNTDKLTNSDSYFEIDSSDKVVIARINSIDHEYDNLGEEYWIGNMSTLYPNDKFKKFRLLITTNSSNYDYKCCIIGGVYFIIMKESEKFDNEISRKSGSFVLLSER